VAVKTNQEEIPVNKLKTSIVAAIAVAALGAGLLNTQQPGFKTGQSYS